MYSKFPRSKVFFYRDKNIPFHKPDLYGRLIMAKVAFALLIFSAICRSNSNLLSKVTPISVSLSTVDMERIFTFSNIKNIKGDLYSLHILANMNRITLLTDFAKPGYISYYSRLNLT